MVRSSPLISGGLMVTRSYAYPYADYLFELSFNGEPIRALQRHVENSVSLWKTMWKTSRAVIFDLAEYVDNLWISLNSNLYDLASCVLCILKYGRPDYNHSIGCLLVRSDNDNDTRSHLLLDCGRLEKAVTHRPTPTPALLRREYLYHHPSPLPKMHARFDVSIFSTVPQKTFSIYRKILAYYKKIKNHKAVKVFRFNVHMVLAWALLIAIGFLADFLIIKGILWLMR